MWVSGSLMRSSTWRSSSVSAPCISSSMSLPSSVERSRTMRGSFCQALPIGCMRVFMTPSCSSAVTLESRCSGTLNSGILVAAHDLEELVAGEHQLGDHRHQVFERVDVDADRLVGDLAVGFLAVLRVPPPACVRAWRDTGSGLPGDAGLSAAVVSGPGASRNARSSSSSETSPGRSGRSSTWWTSEPRRRFGLGAGAASCRSMRRDRFGRRHMPEHADEIGVGAFRLALVLLEPAEHLLEPVDGRQDERDGLAGDRHAVAELAHQRFGGMRQRFEPRQPEKAAGALDGVDEAEDVVENLGVVGLLLETHELDVDHVEALVRLGEEFPQQVVHGNRPSSPGAAGTGDTLRERGHSVVQTV